jgi:hypothetical protein
VPVIVTPTPDHNLVGPGLIATIGASVLDLSAATQWIVRISSDSDNVNVISSAFKPFTNRNDFFQWGNNAVQGWQWTQGGQAAAPEAATVYARGVVLAPGNVILDSGTTPVTYTGTGGIGAYIPIALGAHEAQLPSDVLAQLTQTYDNTNTLIAGITANLTGSAGAVAQTLGQIFSGKTLDVLTEGDLGSKCHPEVLTATVPIGGSAYGLLTEALSWPDWYAFTGPAGDYAQQVLYTLRLARGGNVVLWQGVHTTTHLVYPLPGIPNIGIGLVNLPVDPGEYTVTITPNTGVCVGAQLLGFP